MEGVALTRPPGCGDIVGTQGLFWTTGGGFSNISARAPYQAQEVERYLNHKSITFPASGNTNAHHTTHDTQHTTHDTRYTTTTE
jgi:hypothetical protein